MMVTNFWFSSGLRAIPVECVGIMCHLLQVAGACCVIIVFALGLG